MKPAVGLEDQRSIAEELASLQAENRYLKELKRLRKELAALQAESRRKKQMRMAEELASLQAENRCLQGIARVREQSEAQQRESRRLRENTSGQLSLRAREGPIKLVATVAKDCAARGSETPEPALSEQDIQSIRCAANVFAAAMDCVRLGKATRIGFSENRITATCGRTNRAIERTDASDVGGWLAVFQATEEMPEHYCGCPVLYDDESCVILGEVFGNEGTESLLQYLEAAAERIRDENDDLYDDERLIDPEHYDSYGMDR
jgi:hypothetical protein